MLLILTLVSLSSHHTALSDQPNQIPLDYDSKESKGTAQSDYTEESAQPEDLKSALPDVPNVVTLEPTFGPTPIPPRGWNNVSALENIPVDLENSSLQIKTEKIGVSNEKEINIAIQFVGGHESELAIKLTDPPTVTIGECTEGEIELVSPDLANTDIVTWTISKTSASLKIISNSVTSLMYDFNNSTLQNCSKAWNGTATAVLFTAADTASQEERPQPANCSDLPYHWKRHVFLDKTFPVTPGTEVQISCNHGYWKIGDKSVTCNTEMYADFQYTEEPWCLGVQTVGSEVLAGTKTTLTCTLDNLPPRGSYQIAWSVNGNRTTDGVETGQVVNRAVTSTLTVVSPRENGGDYLCHVEGNKELGSPAPLNIFSMRDVSKDAQVGEPSEIGCFVENITGSPYFPTVVWKRGEDTISDDKKYRITSKIRSHAIQSFLRVNNPTEDANFTCEVTSGKFPSSPPGSTQVSLNTYSVSGDCTDFCMRTQDNAVVECRLQDSQTPMKIRWFKDSIEISGALESFQEGSQRSVMFLKPEGDEKYTCQINSIVRPESNKIIHFVTIPSLPKKGAVSSPLIGSPILWTLLGVVGMLVVAVAVLSYRVITAQRHMIRMNLRLSTREKLDSCSGRSDTIIRNRASPGARDMDSLRRTLDRRSPPTMSQLSDESLCDP